MNESNSLTNLTLHTCQIKSEKQLNQMTSRDHLRQSPTIGRRKALPIAFGGWYLAVSDVSQSQAMDAAVWIGFFSRLFFCTSDNGGLLKQLLLRVLNCHQLMCLYSKRNKIKF